MNKFLPVLIIAVAVLAAVIFRPRPETFIVLTWQQPDTSRSITINYISTDMAETVTVYYDTRPGNTDLQHYRFQQTAKRRTDDSIGLSAASLQLNKLQPGQEYYFTIIDEANTSATEYKFRTLPLNGELRFVAGGDTLPGKTFEDLNRIIAAANPHFAIVGGDIAYADGKPDKLDLWLQWLRQWQRSMITTEGYLIPLIAAVGNHDVNTRMLSVTGNNADISMATAPYYRLLFPTGNDKTFFKRKLGEHGTLFVLDTEHVYPADGEQLNWLQTALASHPNDTFRFASYHIPLYPSFYPDEATASTRLRQFWQPVFEHHHLDIAFENHEHTLKKSWPIKAGQRSRQNEGIYYLGDGNWGTASRTPESRWFIERAAAVNHVWLVKLHHQQADFSVLTTQGMFDDYSFSLTSHKH